MLTQFTVIHFFCCCSLASLSFTTLSIAQHYLTFVLWEVKTSYSWSVIGEACKPLYIAHLILAWLLWNVQKLCNKPESNILWWRVWNSSSLKERILSIWVWDTRWKTFFKISTSVVHIHVKLFLFLFILPHIHMFVHISFISKP